MEIIKASLAAALHSSGGGANLDSVTFTENDTYTPTQPLDGWDEVTVNVPTYEDEYREMLECCEKVTQAVIDASPEPKPTPPIDPDDLPELISALPGYTFPDGTPYSPTILDAVGTDPITDVQTGQTLYCAFHTQAESIGGMQGAEAWYTDSAGNVYLINGDYDGDPTVYYTNCSISMVDSDTGTVRIKWSKRTTQDPSWGYDSDFTQTVSALIGYAATGHTYKVHNN